MLIVPRQAEVRLTYAARTWADRLGRSLLLVAIALGVALARGRRDRRVGESSARTVAPPVGPEGPTGRWGAALLRALPLALLAALAGLRFVPGPKPAGDVAWLDEHASRAFAEVRWEAAAEYARHAIDLLGSQDAKTIELLCLRGEALLRAGHPRLAVLAFAPVVEAGSGPYRPQALYSGAVAREAAGDAGGAAAWRRSLRADHPRTPWAERLDD